MPERQTPVPWERAELIGLLSAAATLAGLCITVVAFMNTGDRARSAASIVDDVLAVCAAAFLLCTYLIFWALRSRSPALSASLNRIIDVVFVLALSAMTLAGFLLIYTIW